VYGEPLDSQGSHNAQTLRPGESTGATSPMVATPKTAKKAALTAGMRGAARGRDRLKGVGGVLARCLVPEYHDVHHTHLASPSRELDKFHKLPVCGRSLQVSAHLEAVGPGKRPPNSAGTGMRCCLSLNIRVNIFNLNGQLDHHNAIIACFVQQQTQKKKEGGRGKTKGCGAQTSLLPFPDNR
jgi:hypothetical protein